MENKEDVCVGDINRMIHEAAGGCWHIWISDETAVQCGNCGINRMETIEVDMDARSVIEYDHDADNTNYACDTEGLRRAVLRICDDEEILEQFGYRLRSAFDTGNTGLNVALGYLASNEEVISALLPIIPCPIHRGAKR